MKQALGIVLLCALVLNVFSPIASAHWEGGTPYPWYLEMMEWGIIIVGLLGTFFMVMRKKPNLDEPQENETTKTNS